MSWITLTTDDVLDQFNETERAAFEASQAADTLAALTSKVALEVRGYVRKLYSLGAAGEIPSELESAAIAIIRYRFLNSLPVAELLTPERVKEKDDALQLLRDVAKGLVALDATFNPAPTQENSASPRVLARDRTFTRTNQDGI